MKGELMEFIKYYKKYIIGGLGILLVFSAAFYFYFKEEKSVTSIKNDDLLLSDNSNLTKEQNLEDKENIIYVDVKGAVKKPGVYELTTNDKIIDAINKAGGIKNTGTTENINLSKRLTNEMVIYIFTKKELTKNEKPNVVASEPCKCETIVVDNCASKEENTISNDEKNANTITNSSDDNSNNSNFSATNETKKININKATKDELTTIKGIGASKAENIIKYRDENGPFKQIEDITKVSGLGESIFNKIKEFITV